MGRVPQRELGALEFLFGMRNRPWSAKRYHGNAFVVVGLRSSSRANIREYEYGRNPNHGIQGHDSPIIAEDRRQWPVFEARHLVFRELGNLRRSQWLLFCPWKP
jgi:hypothetical protein